MIQNDYRSSSSKRGLPPGSLIHIGHHNTEDIPMISTIIYDKTSLEKITIASFNELQKYKGASCTVWVNISVGDDVSVVEEFGREFSIHSLTLEDILNTQQRVKLDEYQGYIYLVLKQFSIENEKINYNQLSIILLDNFIFTFTSNPDIILELLNKRLEKLNSRVRTQSADYLLYAIVDVIVDQYFLLIDVLERSIDKIDEQLLSHPEPDVVACIHKTRRRIIKARRSISPIREVVLFLMRDNLKQIKPITQIYFRDVYDHTLRIIESLDSYREIASGQLEIYLSSISNKMNSIMKFLTMFASIFIPLTFIAGVYGMNFEYMPELKWKYSYPCLWCIFIAIGIGLFIAFKKKKWF